MVDNIRQAISWRVGTNECLVGGEEEKNQRGILDFDLFLDQQVLGIENHHTDPKDSVAF